MGVGFGDTYGVGSKKICVVSKKNTWDSETNGKKEGTNAPGWLGETQKSGGRRPVSVRGRGKGIFPTQGKEKGSHRVKQTKRRKA